MASPMRTNSPIDDPAPYEMPEVKPPKAAKVVKNDWEKLKEHDKYPAVARYLETRRVYHQHFLPGGKAVTEEDDDAKLLFHYKLASAIIEEIDLFEAEMKKFTTKVIIP